MAQLNVRLYRTVDKKEWDNFVSRSHLATFLFQRDFMEYHNDRFSDFSFLIFDDNNLICICPANIINNQVFSHQGLTYGGVLFDEDFNNSKTENILQSVRVFLNKHSITDFYIKGMPEFYEPQHSEVEKKLLLGNNAEIYRKDRVLAIDYSKPFTIHKTKLKNYRKNSNKGFLIEETDDFLLFWNMVLVPRLRDKHNVSPVHSLDEIGLLKSIFSNNIKQFNVYLNNEILAGITIFDKGRVVKSQYGATTIQGEKERALEYLFLYLIYKYKDEGKSFFSMGTVTENNELGYNAGLLKQKEELGCSIYSQEFYRLKIE